MWKFLRNNPMLVTKIFSKKKEEEGNQDFNHNIQGITIILFLFFILISKF